MQNDTKYFNSRHMCKSISFFFLLLNARLDNILQTQFFVYYKMLKCTDAPCKILCPLNTLKKE